MSKILRELELFGTNYCLRLDLRRLEKFPNILGV
jgi:hypothetical protein